MLFWMFYFLYQYPGIMTPDSINQLEQVLHVIPYSNHHPWVHTLLISVFYHLGYLLTGNMVTAMSFYTFSRCVCWPSPFPSFKYSERLSGKTCSLPDPLFVLCAGSL